MRPALAIASAIYGTAVRARAAAYERGLITTTRVSKPVISVGNLIAGGAGKTPFVILLARELEKRGKRAAILSRGYRSEAERTGECLVVTRDMNAARAGDEPVLLAMRTNAAVVVCKDRVRGASHAIAELGAEVLILDDGFQHLKLARDLDIVLLDARDPLAGGRLLPQGMLREPPEALARAHLIAHVGPRGRAPGELEVDVVATTIGSIPAAELRGKRVALIAAIARPERFEETVRSLGAEVVHREWFRDHHAISSRELQSFLATARARTADLLLTTEKDAARFGPALPSELRPLAIEHRLRAGREHLDRALDRILGAP